MTDLLSQASFLCEAPKLNVSLTLNLPRGLDTLLARMLSGWTLVETKNPHRTADIDVSVGSQFHLTSPHYQSGNSYDDIVSILNEVLVALAYACRNKVPNSGLIHAAGFSQGRSAKVMFGTRKAGKSVLTARKAAAGARIYADDLLLWSDKRHDFTSLGIAPRLRRPVLPDILESLGTEAFIVGAYTCYIIADKIDLAPAGSVLQPDNVSELQSDQTIRPIRLWSIKKEIAAHRIP